MARPGAATDLGADGTDGGPAQRAATTPARRTAAGAGGGPGVLGGFAEEAKPYVAPSLEREAGDFVFRFAFPTVHVLVRLAHLHAHHGDFTFNLWVSAHDPVTGDPLQHVHWSKFNISSDTTRNGIVKTLTRKQEHLLDWDRAIEYVCTRTYLALQEGDPPVELTDVEVDESAPNELFEGFLARDQVNTIFAAGGSLKSYIALVATICARQGIEAGPFKPLDRVPTLYLDAETVKQEQALRLRKLCRGLGIEPVQLTYLRVSGPLTQQREQVGRLIARHGIKLVVVDSIAPMLGGSVNDDELVNAFFDVLTGWEGVTCLVISHETKAQRQKRGAFPTPIGSAFVENRSRELWYVENGTPPGADRYAVQKLVMTCTKGNNRPKGARMVVTFRWTQEGAVEVGRSDVTRDTDLVQFRSNKERVLTLLKDGRKRTAKEIGDALDMSVSSVKTAINRLGDRLVVFAPEPGSGSRENRYALTAYPDPVPIRRLVHEVSLNDPGSAPGQDAPIRALGVDESTKEEIF